MIEGGQVTEDLTLPRLVSFLSLGKPIAVGEGEAMLAAVEILPNARLAGRTVAEGIGTIHGATAIAVLRNRQMLIPRGPTRLESGDRLIVVALPAAQPQLKIPADPERIGVKSRRTQWILPRAVQW